MHRGLRYARYALSRTVWPFLCAHDLASIGKSAESCKQGLGRPIFHQRLVSIRIDEQLRRAEQREEDGKTEAPKSNLRGLQAASPRAHRIRRSQTFDSPPFNSLSTHRRERRENVGNPSCCATVRGQR